MSFIPVKLSEPDSPGSQANAGNAFHLSLVTMAIDLLQTSQIPNPWTLCHGFDFIEFTNDIKIHPSFPGRFCLLPLVVDHSTSSIKKIGKAKAPLSAIKTCHFYSLSLPSFKPCIHS